MSQISRDEEKKQLICQHNKETAKLLIVHEKSLDELKASYKESINALEAQFQQTMQESLAVHKSEISEKDTIHEQKLAEMKKEQSDFVASLNASHSSALTSKAKEIAEHSRTISSLRKEIQEELAAAHKEEITSMKVNHQDELNSLISAHNEKLEEQSSRYERHFKEAEETKTDTMKMTKQSHAKELKSMTDIHNQQLQILQSKLNSATTKHESQLSTYQRQLHDLDNKYEATCRTHTNLNQRWTELQDKLATIGEKHETEKNEITERSLELELMNSNLVDEAKELRKRLKLSELKEGSLQDERAKFASRMHLVAEQQLMFKADCESSALARIEELTNRLCDTKKIVSTKDIAAAAMVEEIKAKHDAEMQELKEEIELAVTEREKINQEMVSSKKYREGENAARSRVCKMFLSALENFDSSQSLTNVKNIFVTDEDILSFSEDHCHGIIEAVVNWAKMKDDKLASIKRDKEIWVKKQNEKDEIERNKEKIVGQAWEDEVNKLRHEWNMKLAAKTFVATCRIFFNKEIKIAVAQAFCKWKGFVVIGKVEERRCTDMDQFKRKTNFARGIEKLEFVVKSFDCLLLVKVLKGWMQFVGQEKAREVELEEARQALEDRKQRQGDEMKEKHKGREEIKDEDLGSAAATPLSAGKSIINETPENELLSTPSSSMTSVSAAKDLPRIIVQSSPENIKALKRQLMQEKAARKAILVKAAQKWISPTKDSASEDDFTDEINRAVLEGNSKATKAFLNRRIRSDAGTDASLEKLLLLHRCISGFHFHGNQSLLLSTIEVLLGSGIDINTCDAQGNTILHKSLQACTSNVVISVLKFLLNRGINVNATNKGGESAMHIEIRRLRSKSVEVMRLLLQHGARTDILSKEGDSPLCLALKFAQKKVGSGSDDSASNNASAMSGEGTGGSAASRSSRKSSSIGGEYGGRNFWVRACLLLLKSGAKWDSSFKCKKGRNQLMMLFTGPSPPIGDANSHREVLRNCLGSRVFDVNEVDGDGRSALFLFCLRESSVGKAACISSLGILEDFLQAGADVHTADFDGNGLLSIRGKFRDSGYELLRPSLVEAIQSNAAGGGNSRDAQSQGSAVLQLQASRDKLEARRKGEKRRTASAKETNERAVRMESEVEIFNEEDPAKNGSKDSGFADKKKDYARKVPVSIFKTPTTNRKLMAALGRNNGAEGGGTPSEHVMKLWTKSAGKKQDFSSRLNSLR